MDSVYRDDVLGWWYRDLAKGCRLCMEGTKVVIFVSGLCGINCFYCPISMRRRRADAFFVDEEEFRSIDVILDEIAVVDARGASITGGEPFQRLDLTAKIVALLKDFLGQGFHIHLYTSGFGVTREALRYLDRIGLDEIRFHIVNESVWKLVEFAVRETSMDVGIEIPAIPDFDTVMKVVERADAIGVQFVNLNELEVTETNVWNLRFRGYRVSEDGRAIIGSANVAKRVVLEASRRSLRVAVHFCPAIFKDVVQHRKRLYRKALICRAFDEEVSEDGMLVKGDREYIPTLDICGKVFKSRYLR